MPGNPNPSPETRFKPGTSGNPSGKSTEQHLRDNESSDMASIFRHAVLSSLQEKMRAGVDAISLMTPDLIRIVKDSEDRAHGTPKQSIEHGGEGGGPVQMITEIRNIIVRPGDAA